MRVLVTGATGRIGVHLTRLLLDAGHTVLALAMPGDPRVSLVEGLGVDLIGGHLQDAAILRRAVEAVDAVVHLAAALPARGHGNNDFFEVNLRGTYDLLCAIRDHAPGIHRFTYVSSDTVYSAPAGSSDVTFEETTPKRPESVYGASKAASEEFCLTFQRMYGIPVTIVRPGGTCDAEELITPGSVFARQLFVRDAIAAMAARANPTPELTASIARLRDLHDGTDRQLFIHADRHGNPEICHWGAASDVAAGCILTIEREQAVGEIFNLPGPAPFSKGELVRYIAERTGYPLVEARLPWADDPQRISHAKASALLGYQPRYTVFDLVDEAVAAR